MPKTLDKKSIKRYFVDRAEEWLNEGYDILDGYNYPTPQHRMRIIIESLSELGNNLKVVDLGCGGGDVAIELASRGHTVLAIDQSPKMLRIAQNRVRQLAPDIAQRISFFESEINEPLDVPSENFDLAISMGVIGYIPNDDQLFSIAARLLKPDGKFLVSCRNQLFNMVSFSARTKEEIRTQNALILLDEIEELYQSVAVEQCKEFILAISHISGSIFQNWDNSFADDIADATPVIDSDIIPIEPRQHTPRQITKIAPSHDFMVQEFIGVHPHLLDPRLNRLFPAGVYNRLTGSAEILEKSPISLIWSSVFIAVMTKS
jgi:SAM-dependent methyltransferase